MGAWDQVMHPDRRRATVPLVAVTAVAAVAMPVLLVGAIELGARTSGHRQSALPVVALLSLAVLVATLLVQRWMGAGWGVMGTTAGLWLFVLAAAYLATERERLEAVGERTLAVVAERQSATRARDHVCRLERSSDGRPIEPTLTGSDCYQLHEGELVTVIYDPAGEVPPMDADRFDRGDGMRAAATVLAWVYAAMIPLAAVRGHVLLRRAEVAGPLIQPPDADSPGMSGGPPPPRRPPPGVTQPVAVAAATSPLAVCGLRCRPRWRLPVFPVRATVVTVGAAVVLAGTGLSYIAQLDGPPERQFPERILAIGVGSAVALGLGVGVIVRLRWRRRQVRDGHRIPVSVYYGSDRGALAGPTAARQAQTGATKAHELMQSMLQPTLVAVTADGAMWTLIPEPGNYVAHTARGALALPGGNPWMLPLYALADDPRSPFERDALARQRPLLGARTNGGVADALARLAGHQGAALWSGDPALPNDPRFCGGPVPGEIVLPAVPVSTERGVPAFGPRVGLVLHRPGDAKVRAGIDRRWSIRRLYFGSDPGDCIGVYATHVAPDAPEARGPHPAPPAIV